MGKEKLLSELKSRVGTTALSDRTIDEYVENILSLVTGMDMVTDEFLNAHVSILKSFEGNLNHEVANRVNTFKTEWSKTHPLDKPTKDPDPQKDDKYEALLKKIESLEQIQADSLKKSAVDSLRNQIQNKGTELNVSNKNLWKDCVNSATINGDTSVEDALKVVKSDYESRLKSYIGDGAIPYGGAQAPQRVSKETANAKREAFKAKMQSQGKLPK